MRQRPIIRRREAERWQQKSSTSGRGPPSGRRGTGRPSQAEARNAGSPPGPPPREYV